MEMIYMLPFFISNNGSDFIYDLKMSDDFFKSLEGCTYKTLIIYNQGCLSNEELSYYLSRFNISYKIIGNGENDGITFSRYSMINYIKENYNDTKYVAEVHLDMIFTPNWHKPLIDFLVKTNEPIISPRIVYCENNLYRVTGKEEALLFPESLEEKINLMEALVEEKVDYGFVHPVIHNFQALKKIDAYDIRFLTGKQGYEDDSVLLGYNYYMGTKENWRPKIYYKSCVYHRTIGQRAKINNFVQDISKNLEGLKLQYGAYGQRELSRIYKDNYNFKNNYENMMIDKELALKEAKVYSKGENTSYKSLDIYESRYILRTDEVIYKCPFNIPIDWWSRFYEYAWAIKFAEENDVCLDAGCGVVHPFKYYLAEVCKEVHGVDIDSNIINKEEILNQQKDYFSDKDMLLAEGYLNKIILKNQNLIKLNYEDESFDKVYCISVLHLIEKENLLNILREIKRVLKKNGLCIITVDVPTISIEDLINNIYEVGLRIKSNLDLFKYENIIYSNIGEGLNCFRILLQK